MRVLVTTASTHGAAEAIGARIGSVLGDRGHEVDVRCSAEVVTVDSYDVVVLGSAVDDGHWREDAKALVAREGADLSSRPVWLFSSGQVGDPPAPGETPADIESVMTVTRAYEHHVFAWWVDDRTVELPESAIVRSANGDDGGWDDVDRWATSIADSISSG
jgi:menaquinone-dependent protoporphyrinogen oxidase